MIYLSWSNFFTKRKSSGSLQILVICKRKTFVQFQACQLRLHEAFTPKTPYRMGVFFFKL